MPASLLPIKNATRYGWRSWSFLYELERDDVAGLKTLGAFFQGEFNALAFFQSAETASLDCRIVHEDIRAIFTFDEAEALRTIDPLYFALNTVGHAKPLLKLTAQRGIKT